MPDSEGKTVVVTSGYFDPIHVGHISLIQESAKLGDKLIVIVNGDGCAIRKKGFVFMPAEQRAEIVRAIKGVDDVMIWDDGKTTYVSGAIEKIKPDIFAKGGDRASLDQIPEAEACAKVGCKIVFNVGREVPVSSSNLLGSYVNKTAPLKEQESATKKVYFSGPLDGNRVETANLKEMIGYAKELGTEVLNDFVGEEDYLGYLLKKGIDAANLTPEQIEKHDIGLLDQATHLIAEFSGASTGVGREIEYARLKGKVGKNPTKLLCLYHKDREKTASFIIRGMDPERYLNVRVAPYTNVDEAKKVIKEFLES